MNKYDNIKCNKCRGAVIADAYGKERRTLDVKMFGDVSYIKRGFYAVVKGQCLNCGESGIFKEDKAYSTKVIKHNFNSLGGVKKIKIAT